MGTGQTAWLCQIDGFARADGAATTIRLASHDDDRLCHVNGTVWWPAIAKLPKFAYDFFDGAFGGQISPPASSTDIAAETVPGFAALMLHDARVRWWYADLGAAWAGFTLLFDGIVDQQAAIRDGIASIGFRVDDGWLDDPLLATYAGTTGAEGEAALKGQVKPLLLGAPRMVEAVLVDSIDTIQQLSDGSIEGVEVAFEDAARFAAPVADYAGFAALDAATIAPGFVATSLAAGLVRHGAPGDGVLTYDVKGSNAGSDGGGWVRRTGAIVQRLAARAGQSAKIDAAALTALDSARPWNVSMALQQQTTMREVAQALAQSINAVAMVTWTGLLTILPIPRPEDATPVGTLAADGTALPPVASVAQLGIASPWWRVAIEAEVTNRVHAADEIRFAATLVPRGRFDPSETYREGQYVDMEDGSSWLYTALTPTAGNAPPTWPSLADSYWSIMSPPANRGKIFVRATAPSAAESNPGDLWQDANGLYWVRRADIHLSIGGDRIMIGGNLLTMVWTPNASQPVRTIGAVADTALAAADAATDALAAIADDNRLTAGEKPTVILQRDTIVAEQTGIDAQATSYGITTEKTAYDAKVAALTAYLASLTTPVPWSDLTGETVIVGTAFRAAFADLFAARQVLLNKISEKAGTTATWGGIGGSGKPDDNADVTAAAQVIVVPPATFKIYRTAAGAVKSDQLPVDLVPSVTKGGVDKRTDDSVSYSVTGTGGLASKVSVNNTNGSADKGTITIANTVTSAGTIQLSVSVGGVAVGTYITQVVTEDDAAPVNNGTSGGTDSSLAAINSTNPAPMSGLDGGDPVMDVTIGSGQTLKLTTNFYYRNGSPSALTMTCKGQYFAGGVWNDMNSGAYTEKQGGTAQKLVSPVEYVEGDMVAEFTKTGLSAATYPVRLVGKLTSGTGTLTPTSGGATSSKT